MLSLSLGQLSGHGRWIGRDQVALCHRQLALLCLHKRTGRLKPAQRTINRAALRRKLPQGSSQRARIRRESSCRRTARVIGNQLVQRTKNAGAPRTKHSRPGKIHLKLLPARRRNKLHVVISVVGCCSRISGGIKGEWCSRSLTPTEKELSLVAGIRKRKNLIEYPAQLLGNRGRVARILGSVIAFNGER